MLGGLIVRCPCCEYGESKVIDSRPVDNGHRIKRRRECMRCAKRFTTYEMIEMVPLMVVKKNGAIEAFSRNKLLSGLLKACEKRHVSIEVLEKAVNDIEVKLQNSLENEIKSDLIGEYAMEKLKTIDEVAYVRFASVYREFKDINTFMDELKKLLHER